MGGKHRRLSWVMEHPDSAANAHCAGVNCVVGSWRAGHVLTGGRDGKVLEWDDPFAIAHPLGVNRVDCAAHAFRPHADWVHAVVALPALGDGRGGFVSGGSDHAVALCHAASAWTGPGCIDTPPPPPCRSTLHAAAVRGLAACGSARVFTASVDATSHVLHVEAAGLRYVSSHSATSALFCVAQAGAGADTCYAGALNGSVYLVDPRHKAASVFVEDAHDAVVRALLCCADGLLVTGASDALVRVWDTRHVDEPLLTIDAHSDSVWALTQPPAWDTRTFLTAGRDGVVHAHDLGTMTTATVAQLPYPVASMHATQSHLFVATSHRDVNIFELPPALFDVGPDVDVIDGGGGAALVGLEPTTPLNAAGVLPPGVEATAPPHSRRAEFSGQSHDSDAAEDATEDDAPPLLLPRGFESEGDDRVRSPYRIAHMWGAQADAELWCSGDPSDARPPMRPAAPAALLVGTQGFRACTMLPTRRHVGVQLHDGTVCVWDILARRQVPLSLPGVRDLTGLDAVAASRGAVAGSWCAVDCRWGALCVTLSAENFDSSVITEWELESFSQIYLQMLVDDVVRGGASLTGKDSRPGSAGASASVVSLTAAQRSKKTTAAPISIGAHALRALGTAEGQERVGRVLVWWAPIADTPDRRCVIGVPLSSLLESAYSPKDVALPSWVHLCRAGTSLPALPSGNVNIGLVPLQNPGFGRKPLGAVSATKAGVPIPTTPTARSTLLRDLCLRILTQLKLDEKNLPKLNEVNAALTARGAAPLARDASSSAPDADRRVAAEEYVQLFTASDPPVLVDPLLTAGVAYNVFREKGETQLILRYASII